MNILHINAVSGIRSTGSICVELAEYQNRNGHDACIAFSDGIAPEKGYRIGSALERKLHALGSRLFGLQGYFSRRGTRRLLCFMDKFKPDLVHLHNLHGNYINLKLLLEYLARHDIPTVLTLHDCWFYTGKCTHYTVDGCNQWMTGCGRCPRLRKDNKSWLLDRTRKMWKDKGDWFQRIPRLAVVGVSDWITAEAARSFLFASAPATVPTPRLTETIRILLRIYNWVDLEVFRPMDSDKLRTRLGLDGKFVILGVASRWDASKGLEQFVELAERLPDEMQMILVGTMDKRLELPSKILSLPETHNTHEMAQYYSLGDVLVNLSLEESFGKVAAEAMACGTPVIAARSTANPELVGDGCGYVIDRMDTSLLLELIELVHENTKQRYSSSCRAYVESCFRKEDRMREYLRLYGKLVEEGSKL